MQSLISELEFKLGQHKEPVEKVKPKFEINELPFEQLEKIGLDKQAFLKLTDANLIALLSGKRSDIIKFSNLEIEGNKIEPFEAKISFTRNLENNISVAFHPRNKYLNNEYSLSVQEIVDLTTGKVPSIIKPIITTVNDAITITPEFKKTLTEFEPIYVDMASREGNRFDAYKVVKNPTDVIDLWLEKLQLSDSFVSNSPENNKPEKVVVLDFEKRFNTDLPNYIKYAAPVAAQIKYLEILKSVYEKADLPIENKDLQLKKVEEIIKDLTIAPQSQTEFIVVQYDKEINAFVAESQQNIVAPDTINDTKLTENQKKTFTKGEEIEVDGQPLSLDLKGLKGFAGKVFLFGLDGGMTMLITSMIKYERERAASAQAKNANAIKETFQSQYNSIQKIKFDSSTEQIGVKNLSGLTIKTLPENEMQKDTSTIGEILLEHGSAPFQNIKENKQSYFVKIGTPTGEKTVWGIDLKRAIEESGVQNGDRISLNNLGQKEVKVQQAVRDDEGKVLRMETITANRNAWEVVSLEPKSELSNSTAIGQNGVLTTTSMDNTVEVEPKSELINSTAIGQNEVLTTTTSIDNIVEGESRKMGR